MHSGQMPSPLNATAIVWWMFSSRLPNGYLSGASSFPSFYLDTKHTRRKKSSILEIYRMLSPICWRMTIILSVSQPETDEYRKTVKLISVKGSYDNFCLFCQIESSSKKKDDLAFFIFFTFKGKFFFLIHQSPTWLTLSRLETVTPCRRAPSIHQRYPSLLFRRRQQFPNVRHPGLLGQLSRHRPPSLLHDLHRPRLCRLSPPPHRRCRHLHSPSLLHPRQFERIRLSQDR